MSQQAWVEAIEEGCAWLEYFGHSPMHLQIVRRVLLGMRLERGQA